MSFKDITVQIPDNYTKNQPYSGFKPVNNGQALIDDLEVFAWCLDTQSKSENFYNGNRNVFVTKLAFYCNDFGVSKEVVLSECISRFATDDFDEKEISTIIKSTYSKTDRHGSKQYKKVIEKTKESAAVSDKDKPKEGEIYIATGEAILSRGIQKIPTLLDPIFPQVGLVALAGSSDTGKSSILRQFAIAVSLADKDFLGWPLNLVYKSAIYVSTEDDELAVNYLLNKQTHSRCLPPKKYKNLRFLFDTTSLLDKLDKELTRQPADCVIIDAFTDLYSGSLNQTNEVRTFLNKYKLLADKHKCLIIFLHHTGKKTEDLEPSKHNLLGSQGFEAKMRLVIELRTDVIEDDIRHLCLVKGNYLPREYKQSSYVLRFDENMLFSNTEERIPFEQLAKAEVEKEEQEDERMKKIFKAIEMRNNGYLIQPIADELGVKKGTISKWLSKYS